MTKVKRPAPRRIAEPVHPQIRRAWFGARRHAASSGAGGWPVEGLTHAQAARVLTGLLWLAWGAWLSVGPGAATAPLFGSLVAMAGIGILAGAVLVHDEPAQRTLDAMLIAGTLVLIVLLPVLAAVAGGYATDELAYDQAAAAGLLHGINPYTGDFTQSLQTFGVGTGATMTLHGTVVPYIAYPALSFLIYVPAVAAFGAQSYAGLLVDVLAWAVGGWIMWKLLSPQLRPWLPALLTVPAFLGAVMTGATDSLFVPFELIAVCGWDRFARPAEGRRWRWAGPIALGLACCMKQQPWLLVPFLVLGVSLEAHRQQLVWWRVAGRYVALAGAAFLLPNVAFIAWNPGAWVSRLAMPLTGGLVPMGLGPAGLMRPFAIGGGNLTVFGLASAAAIVAALALFVVRYERMRRILPLLPLGALFLSTRSFSSYFTFCVPALVMNAATLQSGRTPRIGAWPRRLLSALAAAGVAVALVLVGIGLTSRPPLAIAIASSGVSQGNLVASAEVTNLSGRTLTPHFFLAKGLYYNQQLSVVSGPESLRAGETRTYRFAATLTPSTPHAGDAFQLQAGTVSPDTISTSAVADVGSAG